MSINVFLFSKSFAQQHTFEVKNGSFVYDGKPIQIHSGEMHYSRVPHEYWRQRLKMIKAMGMNTVTTYVFWNFQETAPGVWNFSGDRDIAKFIKTAQDVGLFVILRPGPYVCAEWEFGGYPWWLQKVPGMHVRTLNQPFLDSCKTYIQHLAAQIKNLQITHGGPIIMVQAENEFGSYVAQRKDIPLEQHKKYALAIKNELVHNGFDVPFFTADATYLFKGGSVEGALPCGNGEDNVDTLKKRVNEFHNGEGPYMVSEFYPGWLDHWGEKFVKVGAKGVVNQTEKYLKNGVSFSYYMIFGGTNFGFTSGANDGDSPIQPDLTSYDYDAPISEAGWATPKFDSLRSLMKKYVTYQIPDVPDAVLVIAINEIKLNKTVDLFNGIVKNIQPVVSDTPKTFEDLNQGFGYVLYRKKFDNAINGTLDLKGLRDYALVYVNGKKVGELNRQVKKFTINIDIPANATLDILVENMGRINYGPNIEKNLKGIISPVMINGKIITGNWNMYKLPFDQVPDLSKQKSSYVAGNPVIYQGAFKLKKVGDTFLDMSNWGKGIVFINGHNLGRYWKVGPQQTLYLPGCWLKKGKNTIQIFEQQNDVKNETISSVTKPVLDKLNLPKE
ncbi:glycoside hydrolase family 35 protein [Arachidicoccus ginsenosidimutans]|uniref:glycoside hydrolase family 35 protein n=1 Tax=Arachidicoccus sp. BS20 TaxID=1850526 RepID=UPI001E650AF4|nr:beta-galactosidase family protein [Arachidicoccus sp. BS20]